MSRFGMLLVTVILVVIGFSIFGLVVNRLSIEQQVKKCLDNPKSTGVIILRDENKVICETNGQSLFIERD